MNENKIQGKEMKGGKIPSELTEKCDFNRNAFNSFGDEPTLKFSTVRWNKNTEECGLNSGGDTICYNLVIQPDLILYNATVKRLKVNKEYVPEICFSTKSLTNPNHSNCSHNHEMQMRVVK